MADLNFYFGTMGSAKTNNLLIKEYNYRERGLNTFVLKPKTDTREGETKCVIKSRTGLSCEGHWINDTEDVFEMVRWWNKYMDPINAVFVDEVQFCTKEQILQLSNITTELNIPVKVYGLKNNFKGELFSSIVVLMAYADKLKEYKSICHCGNKCNHNALIVDGKIIREGNEIQVEGKDKNYSYVPLCNKCFREGNLH